MTLLVGVGCVLVIVASAVLTRHEWRGLKDASARLGRTARTPTRGYDSPDLKPLGGGSLGRPPSGPGPRGPRRPGRGPAGDRVPRSPLSPAGSDAVALPVPSPPPQQRSHPTRYLARPEPERVDGALSGTIDDVDAPNGFKFPHDRRPEYVGLTEDQARALARSQGVDLIRVARPGDILTMDLRPARLNLLIKDGFVVDAGRF